MKQEEDESLQIVNIVASGTLADSIDLGILPDTLPGCTFNAKRFPGAIFRMQDPKCVALIFSTGKIVLTGFHSLEDVPVGLERFVNMSKKAGISCYPGPKVDITNIVCSYSLGYQCNLNRIVTTLQYEHVEYEPEQFPGLVYRIPDPKIVVLIFTSGNIILTGGKNMESIKRGLIFFKEVMETVG
ncbi:MAG: TATA-box-binding protein [Methanospirillum sp.]|uniref:TATA-box-binding protein n=1 Tax=Methanospirillum sp. TaxID=45200 RepID=UPI002374A68F|nr:TATA-box-binding protein [Methanospirillum sp.]MDD1728418.1 TATA-box-binding protein [Methanospirillum sp.]